MGCGSLIPQIADYHHGPNQQVSPTNFDYSIVADFAWVEAYVTYRDHPEHQRFIAEHITGRVADRATVQFEF